MTIKQLHQSALKAINNRQWQVAHSHCVTIIQQQPDHADAYFLLGIINAELGQVRKAIALMEKAISFDPQTEYYAHLAKCQALTGNMNAAIDAANHAPQDKLSNPLTLDTVGVALSRIGRHQQALGYFQKALSITHDNPAFYYNYGVSCKFAGQFDDAEQAFEQAIKLHPDYYQAHFALSDLTSAEAHIPRLQQSLSHCQHPDGQLHLCHALAKEFEAQKDYQQAFTQLQQGKQAKLATLNYQVKQDLDVFQAVTQLSQQCPNSQAGCEDNSPIFILGMPRSGTTLVERILSNHSEVTSAGELQDFGVAVKELTGTSGRTVLDIETLQAAYQLPAESIGQRYIERTRTVSGSTAHFVDKLPFNFFYVDLIRKALPNARIVCLLRNPMDTCIGNFRQLFSINSPYYFYAYDLLSTGQFYAAFYRLAQHWQTLHRDNVMLLDYQQLVNQPQQQVRQLLEFCELDWQPQCVEVENNQAPVSTASKVQVREPINNRSIGRWKHYQPHTQALEDYFKQQNIPF